MNFINPFSFLSHQAFCGGVYSGINGTISSPNYPQAYPNFVYCLYTITVPYGGACLEFTEFNTEQSYDYVTIYEGVTLAKRIGRYI